MSNVYISSRAIKAENSREVVNVALRHGFTHVELTAGMEYAEDLLTPIRAVKDKIQFIVHHYFPPAREPFVLNLASTITEVRERSIAFCESAIRLSVVLGAPFYSVHGGYTINLSPDDFANPDLMTNLALTQSVPYDQAYGIMIDSVGHLNDYAKEWGIQLLLQNNVVTPFMVRAGAKNPMLLCKADEFERVKRDIPDENLGFLIDLGHLEIASGALYFNKLYFLERIRSYIYALHLSENDGQRDTNEPITPVSWFIPILKTFPEIPMVLHAYNLTPEQIRQQIDMVVRYRKPGTGALISRDE